MGKWYNGTKNRNRGNGVIRRDKVQMAKRAQNRDQWQKEHKIGTNGKRNAVALTEVDKRRVRDSRELITNTSNLLTHYAT